MIKRFKEWLRKWLGIEDVESRLAFLENKEIAPSIPGAHAHGHVHRMKLLLLLFLFAIPAYPQGQQGTFTNPQGGNLIASSTDCSVVFSCVWMKLPFNANTSAITLAGTFSATALVEESGNNGVSFTTVATLSSVGLTTYPTNGLTDIRVRVSAFTSGQVSVTISTGVNTGPQGPPGPAGSGGGLPAGGLIGQIPVNTAPGTGSWQSSGVPLCNGGTVIAATPYTLLADSGTATRDRSSLCEVNTAGAGTFHVLAGSTSGVGTGFIVGFMNKGTGTWTIDNNAGTDTFDIFTGSGVTPGATSFTVTTGQHLSMENSGVSNLGGGVIWTVREVTGGGGAAGVNLLVPRNYHWGISTVRPASSASDTQGCGTVTETLTAGAGFSAPGTFDIYGNGWRTGNTGTTANTPNGWAICQSTKPVVSSRQPNLNASFGIGTTTSVQAYVILSSSAAVSSAGLTSLGTNGLSGLGFRFLSGSDGTTWHCVLSDGSHADQVIDSTIAVDTSNRQDFDVIVAPSGTTVSFYIQGVSVCGGPVTPTNAIPSANWTLLAAWQNLSTTAVSGFYTKLYWGNN
jgi:hypothetical protein